MDTDNVMLSIDDQYELIDIDGIEIEEGEFKLYDMEVEEDNTFCITNDNIISHNCKSMMRVLTYKCARAGVPLIFTNHIYANPAQMYPSLVQTQSGGSGPLYLASILLQLSVRQEKIEPFKKKKGEDDNLEELTNSMINNSIAIAHNVNGITVGAMSVKNRFIPAFLKTELYLNFKTGIDKYAGIKDIATAFGLLKAIGPSWELNGESIGYAKVWENDPEFWAKRVMPQLEIVLQKELAYSQTTSNEIAKDIDNITKEE